jgi:hypothetical protein
MTAVHAAQLDDHQLQLIRDTAASICDTVKEAKGQKSDVQIRGDVKAQLGGLVRRLANGEVAGQGAIDRSEFEGLSQDATAIAMGDDRACRERLFGKMFDAVSAAVVQPARNPNALYQYDEKVADVQGAVVLPSQGTASFQMIHMIAQIDPTHELEYQDWVLVCPDLPQPKKGFVGLTSGMITGMSCRTVRRAQ